MKNLAMVIGQGAVVSNRRGRFRNRPSLFAVLVCLLTSCESLSYRPVPITPEVVRAGARAHADENTLREGRTLFVSRCIECHTLPVVWHYQASDWPCLVDEMAGRANLKKAERDAIVAYILAVRAH